MIVSRVAHIALGVEDLDAAIEFYGEMFGLTVLAEASGTTYLACGATNTYELSLRRGAAHVDHFAFAVRGEAALDEVRERLEGVGTPFAEIDVDGEPGLSAGIETSLPSGHVLQLVVESAPSGFQARPAVSSLHHRGVGPVALEHITLLCDDISAVARFAIEVLDLEITDSVQPPDGPWGNTHLRAGVLHHDLGLLLGDQPAMHHFAFAVPSVADLVRVADMLAARGMVLDCSIGRHVAGNNVFVYFKDPAGHRVEVNTDMARVDAAAAPRIADTGFPFDAWRAGRPPALAGGSPVRVEVLATQRSS